MQLTDETRSKLSQRLKNISREKGKGILLLSELAGLSVHTLHRLRDGGVVKEDTVRKLVEGIRAYDNYVPPQTQRQKHLTESLLSVL